MRRFRPDPGSAHRLRPRLPGPRRQQARNHRQNRRPDVPLWVAE